MSKAIWDHIVENLSGYLTFAGSIILGFVAIFQDCLKPNSKLDISGLRYDEINTDREGNKRIYYLFDVRNVSGICSRFKTLAKNSGVFLVGISRKKINGDFEEKNVRVPWQFSWAPAELALIRQNIIDNSVCGFGYIGEKENAFVPSLYVYPNTFSAYGLMKQGEVVRYHLKIDAENFQASKIYVIEVSFENETCHTIEEMLRCVNVKAINF